MTNSLKLSGLLGDTPANMSHDCTSAREFSLANKKKEKKHAPRVAGLPPEPLVGLLPKAHAESLLPVPARSHDPSLRLRKGKEKNEAPAASWELRSSLGDRTESLDTK